MIRKPCKHKDKEGLCVIECALNNCAIDCWECEDYYAGYKGAMTPESYEKLRGDKN